jgi:hypothetical protein
MSKVTVITDAKGQIQAIGHGHLSEATARKQGTKGLQGGLRPLPGQNLQELELANDVTQITAWKDLVEKVRPHLKATG